MHLSQKALWGGSVNQEEREWREMLAVTSSQHSCVLGALSKSAFTSKERQKQTKFLITGILALNPGCPEVVLPQLTSRCQKTPIYKNKKTKPEALQNYWPKDNKFPSVQFSQLKKKNQQAEILQLCVTYVSRSLLNWQNGYNSSDYPQIQRGLPGHGRTDLVEIAIVNSCLTGNSLAFTLLI